MNTTVENRSFSELLSDAITHLTTLFRNEIRLARAELSAKISRAAIALATLVASVAMIGAAMVLILFALAGLLVEGGVSQPAAYFLAGIAGAAVSSVLAWAGVSRLKSEGIAPDRTIEQLHRDAMAAKEIVG